MLPPISSIPDPISFRSSHSASSNSLGLLDEVVGHRDNARAGGKVLTVRSPEQRVFLWERDPVLTQERDEPLDLPERR